MIYLDNAATTLIKPDDVYARSDEVFRHFSANAGRGSHRLSLKAAELIYFARLTVKDYFNCPTPENVIFTFGCTDALNIVIKGLFKKGDRIITTAYEHNSVLRPLEYMKQSHGIAYTVVFPDKNGEILPESIEKEIDKSTRAVIVNGVSNVTGYVQHIKKIGEICKKHNILYIVDGAQASGSQRLDIQKMNIGYLCCAGHKGLYGPQGIGLLLINDGVPLPAPLRLGGTGSHSFELTQPENLPDYLESGTLTVQGIASLQAGIEFVKKHDILAHEYRLSRLLRLALSQNKKIRLYSRPDLYSSVTAFNIGDIPSQSVCDALDKRYSICARGGFHCAPLVHKLLGTESQGAVRLSVGYFNTENEIKTAINAINELS